MVCQRRTDLSMTALSPAAFGSRPSEGSQASCRMQGMLSVKPESRLV